MEVDSSIDYFSPKKTWCLGVDQHRLCFLGDGLDYVFGNPILMMKLLSPLFIHCTMISKHQLLCLHCILYGHCGTEMDSLHIPWTHLGPEVVGKMRCLFQNFYQGGPKWSCCVYNHR